MADHLGRSIMQTNEALQRLFPALLPPYVGWFALMRDGERVAFSTTMQEASRAGQQVCQGPGFSGHAVTAGATEG